MKYKEMIIPIYNRSVIFYSGNKDDVNTHYRKYYGATYDMLQDGCDGMVHHLAGGNCAIWVERYNNTPVLVHELIHALRHILGEIGMTHVQENSEAFAYLAGYLTGEWLDKKQWKSYSRKQLKMIRKRKEN